MYKHFLKRLIDIIISLMVIPFLLLTIILVGVIIKMDDRGPIFYLGERLGRNGKTFKMYKFRTMKVNAPDLRNPDGSTFNSESDPRLIKSGRFLRKTSIDEVPQLINVLIGNMSLVGPRPDLPEHINYYKNEDFEKLSVKPGVTGYNQAYFRNSTDWENRKQNDVHYARNISFMFDLKIIFRTIYSVIFRKNIYSNTDYRGNNEKL